MIQEQSDHFRILYNASIVKRSEFAIVSIGKKLGGKISLADVRFFMRLWVIMIFQIGIYKSSGIKTKANDMPSR
jgi:hypothetical protein